MSCYMSCIPLYKTYSNRTSYHILYLRYLLYLSNIAVAIGQSYVLPAQQPTQDAELELEVEQALAAEAVPANITSCYAVNQRF